MAEPRSFSGQVWDLNHNFAEMQDLAARSKAYLNVPPSLEVVWLLPPDTMPENLRMGDDPDLTHLFGIPVVAAPVDRPYLALRPADPPAGDRGHVIRTGMAQVMAEYDYAADTLSSSPPP